MRKTFTKIFGLGLALIALTPLTANAQSKIQLGVPFTLAMGERSGEFTAPLTAAAIDELIVTTDCSTELTQFLYDDENYVTPIQSSELVDGGYVYKFNVYKSGYSYHVLQNQLDRDITFTFTMPKADPSAIEFDVPFEAQEGYKYYFNNPVGGSKLIVTVNKDITENKADAMLAKNTDFRSWQVCDTYKASGSDYVINYSLPQSQIYYFLCPVSAQYTFKWGDDPYEDMEASTAAPYFQAPLPNQELFFNFVISWKINGEDQLLEAGKMGGATITSPNNEAISINNYNLTTIGDGNTYIGLSVNISSSDYDKLKTKGDYTLTLPKGIVLIDGKPNEATTLKYTYSPVAQQFTSEIISNVSSDIVLSSLTEVTVGYQSTVEDGYMVIYPVSDTTDEITVYVNDEEVTATVENNRIIIPVDFESVEELTQVEIIIPENVVRNQMDEVNPSTSVSAMLLPVGQSPIITPENGSYFTEDNEDWTVNLTWGDNYTITFNGDFSDLEGLGISLKDGNGESIALNIEDNVYYDNWDQNSLIFNLEGLEEGDYTLTIAADALFYMDMETLEAYLNPEIILTYHVGEIPIGYIDVEPTATPDNSEALAELTGVILSWGDDVEMVSNPEFEGNVTLNLTQINDEVEAQEELNYVQNAEVVGNALVISFYEMGNGIYTLTVPAEFVVITKDEVQYYNKLVEMVYIVDSTVGITGISSDANGMFTIYNLSGVKVATGNSDVVKSLPKGVYVINGKKVALK